MHSSSSDSYVRRVIARGCREVRYLSLSPLFDRLVPWPRTRQEVRSQLITGTFDVSQFSEGVTVLVFAHLDDELLWMLPFWSLGPRFVYAGLPASAAHERLLRRLGGFFGSGCCTAWGTVTDEEFAGTYLDATKRASLITLEGMTDRLRAAIADPTVARVVTHSNWGEYGHIHHRMLNRVVRRLASEYRKDVWTIALRAHLNDTARYEDTGHLGLSDHVYGWFDDSEFKAIRRMYTRVLLSVPMWGLRDHSLWTWGSGPSDYPTGRRMFIRVVKDGQDLTVGNAAIEALERTVPISGQAPEKGSGAAV